ncbi:rhomboid family intramembrane serine protease [Candidatus Woesearchaeota archaeon]|nr:rhomboid family intramembrane serine protease [Candidatus Woesearchaeota archaeon]
MKTEIQSESKFLWKFIGLLLLTPATLILMLFGKRKPKDLFAPFKYLYQFIFEPKFTITLIIINIAVFIISLFLPEQTLLSLIQYPADLLIRPYTLITAGFLHAGIAHLLGNMLALFIFGRVLERKIGAGKTATIYFGALIISGIFTSIINLYILENNTPGLGASGAIMGLVAAAILIEPFYFTYELIFPLPIMVVGWLTIWLDIIGILNPSADGIGHFAHLGGFLSVAILSFVIGIESKTKMKKGLIINLISLAILIIIYYVSIK